jgi:hypothetical protein
MLPKGEKKGPVNQTMNWSFPDDVTVATVREPLINDTISKDGL